MPVQEQDVIEARSLLTKARWLLSEFDPGLGSFWHLCDPAHWSREAERAQKLSEIASEYEALCSAMMVASGKESR